jgi:DNA mismatch repair protein MutL
LRTYQEQIRSDIFTIPSFSPSSKVQRPSSAVTSGGTNASGVARLPVSEKTQITSDPASFHKEEASEPVAQFHVRSHVPELISANGYEKGVTDFSGLTIVGQLFHLYLLCERDGQLVVIDQHAAHERIIYQQLRSAYHEREIPRQNLLFPVSVEVTPEQAEILEKHGEDIETLGFTVVHFGEETWVVKSVPAIVKNVDPAELLFETLDKLRSGSSQKAVGIAGQIDYLLSSIACKAAVKAGDRLVPEEMLELLSQMQASEYFSHCPHGRPVVKVFSTQDIEKWFHRG